MAAAAWWCTLGKYSMADMQNQVSGKWHADLDAEQVVESLDGVTIEVHLPRTLRKTPGRHVLHEKPAHPAGT